MSVTEPIQLSCSCFFPWAFSEDYYPHYQEADNVATIAPVETTSLMLFAGLVCSP